MWVLGIQTCPNNHTADHYPLSHCFQSCVVSVLCTCNMSHKDSRGRNVEVRLYPALSDSTLCKAVAFKALPTPRNSVLSKGIFVSAYTEVGWLSASNVASVETTTCPPLLMRCGSILFLKVKRCHVYTHKVDWEYVGAWCIKTISKKPLKIYLTHHDNKVNNSLPELQKMTTVMEISLWACQLSHVRTRGLASIRMSPNVLNASAQHAAWCLMSYCLMSPTGVAVLCHILVQCLCGSTLLYNPRPWLCASQESLKPD